MITILIYMVIALVSMVAYSVPGLYLARGMYAEAVRELRAKPVQIVPPRPPRPRVKLNEVLHTSGTGIHRRCSLLDSSSRACNCGSRDEWIEVKNGWLDYEEWRKKYGHITNGVASEPTVNMKPIYMAVPGWPLVAGAMFIKGGAKGIPDYRAIERMENDIKEIA